MHGFWASIYSRVEVGHTSTCCCFSRLSIVLNLRDQSKVPIMPFAERERDWTILNNKNIVADCRPSIIKDLSPSPYPVIRRLIRCMNSVSAIFVEVIYCKLRQARLVHLRLFLFSSLSRAKEPYCCWGARLPTAVVCSSSMLLGVGNMSFLHFVDRDFFAEWVYFVARLDSPLLLNKNK
jgi:hypothetical protein